MTENSKRRLAEEIRVRGVVPGERQYISIASDINRLFEELKQLRKEVSTKPAVIRYIRLRKTIDILNLQGDANISIFCDCKNGRDPVRRLKHRMEYDGEPLSKEDISVIVNGKHLQPDLETFELNKLPGGVDPPFKNLTILYIKPQSPIEPDSAFQYEYTTALKKVYPKVTERDYTSYGIMHVIDSLGFSIRAPPEYRFLKESLDIEVIQYNGLQDTAEKMRINLRFTPIFMGNDTEILWEIKNPKITYTYRVYFQIKHS